MTKRYVKRRYVIGRDWTPIDAPVEANYFGLRHLGAEDGDPGHNAPLLLRTDPDDPNTEDRLDVYGQEGVMGGMVGAGMEGKRSRFQTDDVVEHAKSSGEWNQLVVVTWVR